MLRSVEWLTLVHQDSSSWTEEPGGHQISPGTVLELAVAGFHEPSLGVAPLDYVSL